MAYIASSRSRWVRSECIEVLGSPRLYKKSSRKSAAFLLLTKTMVRAGGIERRRSNRQSRFLGSSTKRTYIVSLYLQSLRPHLPSGRCSYAKSRRDPRGSGYGPSTYTLSRRRELPLETWQRTSCRRDHHRCLHLRLPSHFAFPRPNQEKPFRQPRQ